MVLNDIVLEYKVVKEIIDGISDFIEESEKIVSFYFEQEKNSMIAFYSSSSTNPASVLSNELNKSISNIYNAILHMNSKTRSLYKSIALLESKTISDGILSKERDAFIDSINKSIDIMFQIIELQLEKAKKRGLYNDFLESLRKVLRHYNNIDLLYENIVNIESRLYEPLPKGINEDETNFIEIKSNKECLEFGTYSDDIQKLSQFLIQFEMIKYPGASHKIFTRRIESGSLRIVLGSKEIELSCISDIINSLVSAIRIVALLPAEVKLKNLDVEAKKIENESARDDLNAKKLTIINSQIDNLIDKLELDKNNPEDKEKIQLLCLPLIDYLNSNPIGSINGVTYDLTHELVLLEEKTL